MEHADLLYHHSRMISVRIDAAAPIELCVSQLRPRHEPAHPGSESRRARLVLLHGNPANMHDFGPLAARLGAHFELVALDLPGFGRSQSLRPAAHESVLHSYARHVQAALAGIGWASDCYVLGHSHGAAVAQTLAALYPEQVSGLALLAAVGTPAHWGYRQLALPGVMTALRVLARGLALPNPRSVRRRLVREIMTPIFAPHPVSDAWIDVQLAVVDRRPEVLVNMALVATGDPCAQLGRSAAQIRAPTLFIHGGSDRLVPKVHAHAIYDIVSHTGRAEFHELRDAGHMLQITHPREIERLLLDWVRRLPQDERKRGAATGS